jgi:hypothetical protein
MGHGGRWDAPPLHADADAGEDGRQSTYEIDTGTARERERARATMRPRDREESGGGGHWPGSSKARAKWVRGRCTNRSAHRRPPLRLRARAA